MRIGFLDPVRAEYTAATPYDHPLGGSQSAVCYLAAELSRLGHEVTIFNASPTTAESLGVRVQNMVASVSSGALRQLDKVVVLSAAIGRELRREAHVSRPLILWNHHAHNQPAVQALSSSRERKSWTAFVLVSGWQQKHFERAFWIAPDKTAVRRNAVSPAFLDVPAKRPWFETGEAPVLVYTSTPFRGLDVLLDAFPTIRKAIPGTRLRVFSSMGVYQVHPERDQFDSLYQLARDTDGSEYIGSVGQRRLAEELSGAAALAYPSTFDETSCISVIEAMAAGAAVFSTDLGAIPETSAGHASLVPFTADRRALAKVFAEMVVARLIDMRERPAQAAASRAARLSYARDNYSWPERSKEWADWLVGLEGTAAAGVA